MFLLAMVLGENMVNINVLCFVQRKVHFPAADEIFAMIFQNQCHDPLIGRTLAGLEREQTSGIEIGFLYCFGDSAAVVDPIHNTDNIVHITGFISTAVQLTKDTTPVPMLDFILNIRNLNSIAICKQSTKNSQWNQLSGVRKISAHKDPFLLKDFLCLHKALCEIISVFLVVNEGQIQNILLFAADSTTALVG